MIHNSSQMLDEVGLSRTPASFQVVQNTRRTSIELAFSRQNRERTIAATSKLQIFSRRQFPPIFSYVSWKNYWENLRGKLQTST